MKLTNHYARMSMYYALLPDKHPISLDDIDVLYPMRLNRTTADTIWYDWSTSGKLILHNGSQAVVEELVLTVDDTKQELCYFKGKPLLAMTLRRMSCPPLYSEPGANCFK